MSKFQNRYIVWSPNRNKLTRKQWEWLVEAPAHIEHDGHHYDFMQGWDENGKPVVHFQKRGHPFLRAYFSPDRELGTAFRQLLHELWDAWHEQLT